MSATLRVRGQSSPNAFVSTQLRRASTPSRVKHTGAAIAETIIALPILLVVILGAIQFGLIYQAKATLNHAALQAARAGAVDHANAQAIRNGLAKGLLPLYSPASSLTGVATTLARINGELATAARIRILNPTREAFEDFGEEVEGVREIPNHRLHARSTTIGTQSGLNIQDANILRVEITYGYELKVPLVNWFITRTLLATRGNRAVDAFEQQLLRRTLLPIVATSTVRMQSPARLNDLFVSRADLPNVPRIDASSAPPEIDGEEDHEDNADEEDSAGDDEDENSSLADGFFGFGSGRADDSGGDASPGGSEGGSNPGAGGGENSGNPQMCSVDPDHDGSPFAGSTSLSSDTTSSFDSAPDASQPAMLPSLSVGNPIHVVTGNKYQREIDLPALPGPGGLVFARHYNTDAVGQPGVLGAGWRHSYQASLLRDAKSGTISIVQADGRRAHFARDDEREEDEYERYIGQRANDGHVEARGDELIWRPNSQRALRFDAQGHLVALKAGTAESRLYYDRRGRLERVQDAQNRTLQLVYYRTGRLARLVTPVGTWRYRYDDVGNLSAVESPDKSSRRYEYSDARHPHHLTSITVQPLGLTAYGAAPETIRLGTWKYDELGRGVLSTHPDDAGKVSLSYGDGYTDVADAFGRTSRYITELRDGIAMVTEVRGPGCGVCGAGDVRYRYNERLQVTDAIPRSGIGTHHTYDGLGRLIETAQSVQGGKRSWQARFVYEGTSLHASRIERPSINPDGVHSLEFAYTEDGQVLTVTERGYTPTRDGAFASLERTLGAAYDAAGRMVAVDGPRAGTIDLTRLEYDAAQRLVATIDADGIEQRVVSYDAAGRPTRLRRTGSPDLELRYDSIGRLTMLIEHRSSGEQVKSFAYDAAGRALSISRPDGSVQKLGRDRAGRINRREYGGLIQASLFGADGQLAKSALLSQGAISNVLHFDYDTQRRLIEIRDGDGPPLRQLIYTDDDMLADRLVDPLGRETGFRYDDLGRLAEIMAADGGSTRLGYTARGALESITAPNGALTRYEYDDFGRRVREHSADRGTTHYVYDSANNLVEKTDARGSTTTLTYTSGNRVDTVTTRDGTTRFAYVDRRLAKISGPWGEESYEYDPAGRLSKHTRLIAGRSFTTAYRYDKQNRLARYRTVSGEWLARRYDDKGALTSIAVDGLLRDHTLIGTPDDRGALSPLGDLELGNALTQNTAFDERGRLRIRRLHGIADLRYHYDEANRLVRVDEGDRRHTYEYDTANRLIAATEPGRTYRYQYDSNGNRISTRQERILARSTDTPPATHTYTSRSNRLLPIKRGSEDIQYDAAGSLLRIANRRYEYDGSGRPIRLLVNDRLTAEYTYNAWGERIRKIIHTPAGTRTTLYVYEQHRLVAEADEDGGIMREYVYLDHHPVALLDRGVPYWIHTDHVGTPIAVTDAKRRIVWRAQYEPFGHAHVEEDPDGDGNKLKLNLRFPGQYADAESGTYYNVMRTYDPRLGRYLESDPLGIRAGLNTYSYALNSPLSHFDSLGLYEQDIHYYMTLFLAITAGIDPRQARDIALAAAFVDQNPFTRPVDDSNWIDTIGSAFENQESLLLYHFVLSGEDGETLPAYDNSNTRMVFSQQSPQLEQLLRYATTEPQLLANAAACDPTLVQLQFLGEYVHAFQDTFAHRDRHDRPYDALSYGSGLGHGPDGNAPDYTYDEGEWISRSVRTLGMEMDLRDVLRRTHFANPDRATTADQIDVLFEALTDFNSIREDEQNTAAIQAGDNGVQWTRSQKIARLNQALVDLGYTDIDLTSSGYRFDAERAFQNRSEAFSNLDPEHYRNAILETAPAE